MQILGDSNATLKDLTRVVEAEIMEADDPLYPKICSEIESADEAYIKIPIQTKVEFPVQFTGEREDTSTDVNIVQTYNKATYALTLDFDSDLMREAKAYTFQEKVQEGTISAKIFPSYNLTNLVSSNGNGYDGKAFYANNHKWANAGNNTINNTLSRSWSGASTAATATALANDLQAAVAKMRTFLDDKGRLLNPMLRYGSKQLIIHTPAALEVYWRQVLFSSMIPVAAPVTTSGTAAASGTGMKDLGLDGIATLVVDGYLDGNSTTTWYLHYVGMPQRPFIYGESYALEAKALGFGSEFETNTNKVRIALKHRFVEGYYRFDRSMKIS